MIVFVDLVLFLSFECCGAFFAGLTRDEAASFLGADFFAATTFARDVFGLIATFALLAETFVTFAAFFDEELFETTTRTTFFEAPEDTVRFDGCLVFSTFFKDAPRPVVAR